MNKYEWLVIAEQLIDEQGDANWWLESYARYRQHWGIHISIERALNEQGLWAEFEARVAAVPGAVAE